MREIIINLGNIISRCPFVWHRLDLNLTWILRSYIMIFFSPEIFGSYAFRMIVLLWILLNSFYLLWNHMILGALNRFRFGGTQTIPLWNKESVEECGPCGLRGVWGSMGCCLQTQPNASAGLKAAKNRINNRGDIAEVIVAAKMWPCHFWIKNFAFKTLAHCCSYVWYLLLLLLRSCLAIIDY